MHDGNEDHMPAEGVVVRKRRKGIYILPNLFTLAALFGGFYAVVMAMNGRFDLAAGKKFVVLGMRYRGAADKDVGTLIDMDIWG